MVAAFRDEPEDLQLPFQKWPQHSAQVSSSRSLDDVDNHAVPVRTPLVQLHPFIRPPLSQGAIVSSVNSSALQVNSQTSAIRRTRSTRIALPAVTVPSASPSLATTPATATPATTAPATTTPATTLQSVRSHKAVVHLPKSTPYAPWVQRLIVGQKGICLLTLTLVGCALSLSGQSVYQHRQWGQFYAQLERLRKLEQQGIAASEIMKQSLAEEAEHPTSDMTSQMPNNAISLETAPARSSKEEDDILTKSVLDLGLSGPMGY